MDKRGWILQKKVMWEYEETKELLNIMVEQNSLKYLSDRKCNNVEIYQKIQMEMRRRGFTKKNDKHIYQRWRNLKHRYAKLIRMHIDENEPIAKEANCAYPYINELSEMLGTFPNDTNKSLGMWDDSDDSVQSFTTIFLPESSRTATNNVITNSKISQNAPLPATPAETAPIENSNKFPSTSGSLEENKVNGQSTIIGSSIEKLGNTIQRTQEELMKQFFERQKELIDYEFNLYLQKEKKFEKKFEDSTKRILEDTTKVFLNGLQKILEKNNYADKESEILKFTNLLSD